LSVQAILDEVRTLSIPERKQLISLIVDTLTIQDEDDNEAEWEEAILMPILGESLRPDGSIDVAHLRQRGQAIQLDNLYPATDEADEG